MLGPDHPDVVPDEGRQQPEDEAGGEDEADPVEPLELLVGEDGRRRTGRCGQRGQRDQ